MEEASFYWSKRRVLRDGNGKKIRYLAGSTNTALPSGTDVWQRVQPSLRHTFPCSRRRYWHPTFELSQSTKKKRYLVAPNPKTSRPSFLPQRALGNRELDSHPSASLHEERRRRNIRDVKSGRYVYTCWYATKRDAKGPQSRKTGGSTYEFDMMDCTMWTGGFVSRSIHVL